MSDRDLLLAILAELRRLREALGVPDQRAEVEPERDGDDFAPGNLIETAQAAHRAGVEQATIRRWCRDEAIGVRHRGRWRVSAPRLARR